jgi:IS30 family transposase
VTTRTQPWTEDETATLRRMSAAGYADREIANHLKRPHKQIQRKRTQLGIPASFTKAHAMMIARMAQRHMRKAA